jgi:ketosteroid isomerase-like protein
MSDEQNEKKPSPKKHTGSGLAIGVALGVALAVSGCQPAPNGAAPELVALQAQVAELQAKEDIRELFTAYGRTLDNRDFAAFGALYATDSEYVGGGASGTARGPEEIAALLERLITTNATGANLHMYSNENIDVTGDTASATSRGAFYVQDANGGPQPLIFATYNDELVREDGRWKFKRREVIGDIPGPSNEDRNGIVLPDISGAWLIHSRVGTEGPEISVHCTLVQDRSSLSGTCTPEMENPEASELRGSLTTSTARWGYDVVFNGNPGRVDFVATSLAGDALAGNLSLSGTQAAFTAERE